MPNTSYGGSHLYIQIIHEDMSSHLFGEYYVFLENMILADYALSTTSTVLVFFRRSVMTMFSMVQQHELKALSDRNTGV